MSRRRIALFLAAVMVMASLAQAGLVSSPKAPMYTPIIGGASEPYGPVGPAQDAPYAHSRQGLDDPVGELYQAGTTWYDYQHNGTAGHTVYTDNNGLVQVVWMNGLNEQFNPRHVYWNIWDPATQQFATASGAQINASARGGYIALTGHPEGWVFPAWHEVTATDPHASAGIDFLPGSGAFTTTQPTYCEALQLIWPKIAQSGSTADGKLHMVTTESATGGQRIYYSRGTPTYDDFDQGVEIAWDDLPGMCGQYLLLSTVQTIAPDVAASKISNRVAIAWAEPRPQQDGSTNQIDNDLYLLISEDGGENWAAPINVTNFPTPDWECPSGDSLVCNGDTLRLYTDCNVMFDEADNIHVAFTTRTYYGVVAYLDGESNPGPVSWIDQSGVWHWSEATEEFSPVANAYYFATVGGGQLVDVGAWQLNAQRPCLAQDPETGYLYCSYMQYDTNAYSDAFFCMGEAMVSVSCNGGRTWSVGTDVTNTVPGGSPVAPPGSLSERDITIHNRIMDGYIHMAYVLDHDAGGIPQNEGVATLNEVYYQRIPVDQIPLRPLVNPFWPALHNDSTGFPGYVVPLDTTGNNLCGLAVNDDRPALRPGSFALYQNYPNPFNPNTKIQFDLSKDAVVSLKVYNVMGQEVASLFSAKKLSAGVQSVDFNGDNLTSGVYMYRLDVDGTSVTKKMVLMK